MRMILCAHTVATYSHKVLGADENFAISTLVSSETAQAINSL